MTITLSIVIMLISQKWIGQIHFTGIFKFEWLAPVYKTETVLKMQSASCSLFIGMSCEFYNGCHWCTLDPAWKEKKMVPNSFTYLY